MDRTFDKSVLAGVVLLAALLVMNVGLAYRSAVVTELIAAALGLVLVGTLVYLVQRRLQERNRAAVLLHEERERLHTTLSSIGDAVIVTDAGGHVTLMNRVAQDLTGWDDGAVGRPLEEVFRIVNEQTRQPVESPATKVIREGVVVGLANHTVLIAKDGSEVPIDDSSAPIRNAGGGIMGTVLVFRDVTERRRLERLQRDLQGQLERQVKERTAELLASEERFRLLVEGTQDYAIFLLDPQGRVASWNPGAERIKGYKAEEIIGQHFSRFYPQDALDRDWAQYELEIARKEGRFEDKGWRLRKDGSPFWANVILTALRDESGNLRGFSKITRDLTETKQAEENARRLLEEQAARKAAEEAGRQLRASEERLRLFVEHAPASVAMLDRNMNYLLVSQRRLRDFGLEGQNIIGRNYYEVFPNVPERWKEIHRRCLAGASERCEEDHLIRPDGQEVWLHWEVCPWRDQQGEIGGVMVFSEVITERKRAQEAVRQQQEWLRVTLASIGDAVIATDTEGRVVTLNPVAENLTGWTQAEAKGEPLPRVFRIINEQTRQSVENPVEKVLAFGGIVGLANHTILIDKEGVEWPIDDSAAPIKDDQGRVLGVVLVFHDITERRKREEELRKSEARFRAFFTASSETVYRMSPDWSVMHHLEGREFIADTLEPSHTWLEKYIHPDDQQHVMEVIREAIRTKSVFVLEHRVVRVDGTLGWAFSRAVPILDASGEIVEWFGAASDVTRRKEAEQSLLESKAHSDRQRRLYEAILSNTPDFAYIFDLNHRFIYANEILLRTWGKTSDEAVGKNYLELGYEPWQAAKHDQEIEQVKAAKEPIRGEVPFTGTFGRRIYDYIFVPVIGENGEVEAIAGTTRDVTERKQMEETLREQAEQLMEANRHKDEFLGILAHELRNPLAPLRNGLQIMRLAKDNAEAVEQTRSIMERQLHHLVRLVDDLLDVSRISQGKIALRKEQVELATVVSSALEMCDPIIKKHDQELMVKLPDEPVYVEADKMRLAQALCNLLSNASKFSDRKSLISLAVKREENEVVVRVKDNGIGIPASMLSKIFDIFTQVDSSLEKSQGGLGIGLSLVKGLVEMHSGRVEVKSEGHGMGSEFIVRLPIVLSEMEVQEEEDNGQPSQQGTRHRILVVDDNVDAASTTAMVFEMMGHETRTAHDGLEGVEAAAEYRPDLILLDIGMPRMNGYEAARHIRQQSWGKGMLLIAVTGWGQEEDKRRAFEAGFDHHLTKPVEAAALEKLLALIRPAQR